MPERNKLLLSKAEMTLKELSEISKDYQEFNRSLFQAKKLFRELHLTYTSDFTKDYATFLKFKNSYTRTAKSKSKDLVYLSKASFSLAEEIKLYTFMKDELEIKTAQLKKEIKSLKSAFDQSKVKKFNNRLTELYLSSGLNIKHLKEDLQDNDFSLEFDPFRL